LRLLAFDCQDLAVLSANFQDGLVRIGEMTYLPRAQRFVLIAARFDWVRSLEGARERCRAGLHFDHVTKVSRMGFEQHERDAVLNILSLSFVETEPPAGTVEITFSGGAALRLEVECLEAQAHDIGPRWKATTQPGHPILNGDISA